jgi:hypothetical protein
MAEADLAIPMQLLVTGIASFASLARVKMAGTSPAMTGLAARSVRQQHGRLVKWWGSTIVAHPQFSRRA